MSLASQTAKGQGKGKGGGHLLQRTRISAEKFAGTVKNWKGKYGFIQPAEKIAHEKAELHQGALFFSMNDILGGVPALAEGTPVAFHICEDSSGLGAEEVEATGPAPAGAPVPRPAKGKGGMMMPAKGAAKGFAPKMVTPKFPVAVKGFQKGWSKDNGKGFGKSKGKRSPGHELERTRITAEKFLGTVDTWKGKYGWVIPAESVPHEKATKHEGKLFVSMSNIQGESLTPGAQVEFHIYEDKAGLGAEEVVEY